MKKSVRTCLAPFIPSILCLALLAGCGGGGVESGGTEAPAASTDSFTYSGDIRVDSLITPYEQQWNWNFIAPGRALQYTFDVSDTSSASPSLTRSTPFNAAQRSAAKAILNYVTSVTGIVFVESTDPQLADFIFVTADAGGFGQVSWSSVSRRPAAYIALNYSSVNSNRSVDPFGFVAPSPGTFGYMVLLHEIGHALGLKHPTEGLFRIPATDAVLPNTVMLAAFGGGGASTFAPYDLLALKWIYGGDGLGGNNGFNSKLGPSFN